ncbi:UNVERIFIED_CONTAM: UBP1-associated protein 2C [Sesamum latifolium]|uniref:UBP1-associated protein 2C n=1 Tax=Sesamum latifolium TaxID=2727402 RepID=A0AAW2U6W0_9LAMI
MEDLKERKLEEVGNGQLLPILNESEASSTVEELRGLLDPLAKPQLIYLLAQAGSQYPSIAVEIKSVASADSVLQKLFVRAIQEHGEIEEGVIIYDKATGKSRGYGFVTYRDMESAQRSLKAPSKLIDGRMAVCNLASEGLSSTSPKETMHWWSVT